jgi:hypothetical protein
MIQMGVVGRVGLVEEGATKNKTRQLKLSVAVNKKRGEDEATKWIVCVVYSPQIIDYLLNNDVKGRLVYVGGEGDFWNYNDKLYENLIVHTARFLDTNRKQDPAETEIRKEVKRATRVSKEVEAFEDDSMPF